MSFELREKNKILKSIIIHVYYQRPIEKFHFCCEFATDINHIQVKQKKLPHISLLVYYSKHDFLHFSSDHACFVQIEKVTNNTKTSLLQ